MPSVSTTPRLRLRRLALSSLASLAFFTGAVSAPAQGQVAPAPDYWKQTTEGRMIVSRFVYGQSPQVIPPSYDPVAEAEQILRQRQAALPPSNPQAPSLWQQIRGITAKSALSTPPRALGTIGLGIGVFDFGWKIGSGINAKFLKFGIPEASDGPRNYRWNRVVWTRALTGEYSGARWPAEDGWIIWARQTCCNYFDMERWFAAPCPFTGFVPPAPFEVRGPVASTAQCAGTGIGNGYADVNVLYGSAPENAFKAPAPIKPYTNQPYTYSTPAPTPPPQTTVEQSIEDELAKPENNLLRQWLNYELFSPGEEDPLGIELPNPDIEFIDLDRHFRDHGHKFTDPGPPYTDRRKYWRDAADIVKRGQDGPNRDPTILRCRRLGDDPAEIYWDTDRHAWVIVKDGKIVTYYPPDGGFDDFLAECDETF